jgi:2,4-dienoyl-CoA reductase (EC 1.3.1.34)
LLEKPVKQEVAARQIYMFKRSAGKFGGNLGKTTGWIHRANLKKKNVQFIGEVSYTKIDDLGLHYTQNNQQKILDADTIVVCAGQLSLKTLYQPLVDAHKNVHIIGGAEFAGELDAKRAIQQGATVASKL